MPDNATAEEIAAAAAALSGVLSQLAIDEQVAAINAKAHHDIVAIAPEWRQRNMIARTTELQDKRINGLALTEGEEAEIIAMRGIWSQIKAIREQSDIDVAAILEGES
jgi:hypothetical protein